MPDLLSIRQNLAPNTKFRVRQAIGKRNELAALGWALRYTQLISKVLHFAIQISSPMHWDLLMGSALINLVIL